MQKNMVISCLLSISLVFLLTISCVEPFLIHSVHAANDVIQQKSEKIINDVLGFNMSKNSLISNTHSSSDNFLGTMSQEKVRYQLQSNGSLLDMAFTFVGGNLQRIQVLNNETTSNIYTSEINSYELVKTFLNKYQTYGENSFYGKLKSSIDNLKESKNSTIVNGDTKLEVITSQNSTTFRWVYTYNGLDAPDRCVAIRFTNGGLKYFIDNWNIYTIGDTKVEISEQDAINIAIERAKKYSLKNENANSTFELNCNVSNAMIWETILAPSTYVDIPRSKNLFELYPMYHVWVSFDKFYPGNIYGMNIYVWADTGEICYAKERVSTVDPQTDLIATFDDAHEISEDLDRDLILDPVQFTMILLPTLASTLIFSVSLYLIKTKKFTIKFNISKLRSIRFSGIVLCVLLSSTAMISTSISIVSADEFCGQATIWGSESDAAWNSSIGSSWRKSWNETLQQRETAQYLATLFDNNGYDANNSQGDNGLGSYRDTILAQIEYNEENYPRVAVVNFNHGNGRNDSTIAPPGEFHYMFEDQNGTMVGPSNEMAVLHTEYAVYDMEIANKTGNGNTFFIFINTCNSAHFNVTYYNQYNSTQGILNPNDPENQWRARGMPFAWTHRIVDDVNDGNQIDTNYNMSDDGYGDPDPGEFCYLGFFGGSAALNQTIETSGWSYHYWLEHFFAAALTEDISIIDALNNASQSFFYCDFDESPLGRPSGFTSEWPMYYASSGGWTYPSGNGRLAVYGNGELKLYQPFLNITAADNEGSPLSVSVTIDGDSVGSTSVSERVSNAPAEDHEIQVSVPNGYTFQNFTVGASTYVTNPATISVTSDTSVIAYFTEEQAQDIPVTVVIDSVPYDGYTRYHALTVDNDIPTVFWTGDWYNQNQDAIIAITGSTLHYGTTYYLTEGYHTIEYAVSSAVGYEWYATLTVNSQVEAQQYTQRYDQVSEQIYVTSGTSYTLTISAGTGGTTSPSPGAHSYSSGTPVQVTAIEYTDYDFNYWSLDGGPNYNNPITVTMNNNHNLHAYFTYKPPPPPTHYVTVEVWGYYPPWTLMYQEGQYMQEGPQQFSAPSAYGGLPFYAWYHDGNYYYTQSIWISIYSDTYLAALYSY